MSYAILEFDDTKARWTSGNTAADYLTVSNVPARIIIEKNAKLIATNCIFRTLAGTAAGISSTCMWDGIVVLGTPHPDSSQLANNGQLELEDCQITDARVGILAGGSVYNVTTGELLPMSTIGKGGGVLDVERTNFLNSYAGVIMRPAANRSTNNQFEDCLFSSDRPLADPGYVISGVGHGMQYGALVYESGGVTFDNCTFELLDNNAAFSNQILPLAARGIGIGGVIASCHVVNGCVFRNFKTGVSIANISGQAVSVIDNAHFFNNFTGLQLTNAGFSTARECEFVIGRGTDTFARGVWIDESQGFAVERCRFTRALTACGGSPCTFTRGMVVQDIDGGNGLFQNVIYRNYFWDLSEGIYTTTNTQGLLLQCNSFRGTDPETTPVSSITYSDITAQPGNGQADYLRHDHGKCATLTTPANNLFSQTCGGSAKDIRVATPNTCGPIEYAFSTGNTVLKPGGGTSGCVTAGKVTENECFSLNWPGYVSACPVFYFPQALTKAELEAQIDTTSDLATRTALINELLRRYLTWPGPANGGLDSAVALLDSVNLAVYTDMRDGIAEVRDNNSSSRPLAAPRFVAQRAPVRHEAVTARRDSADNGPLDYRPMIRALLSPLGTAEQIRAALLADAPLREQLTAMAADSLTMGYQVARVALTYYLGYTYAQPNPGLATDASQELRPAAEEATSAVRVYPNPATGSTVIACAAWPAGAGSGQVRLYNRFGLLVRTQVLDRKTSEGTTLDLRGLQPGLYQYVVQLGEQTPTRGTLAVQL